MKVCGHFLSETWVEVGGAGSVDPDAFDSKKSTGLAFGFGIERLAAETCEITDIHRLSEHDLRFLSQF